jgi:hypothetical protein
MSLVHPDYEGSPLGGLDVSWLAVDRDGHVAWLVTFGSAVVPSGFESGPETLDNVEPMVSALPEQGHAPEPADGRPPHEAEWHAAARRGLFAYDWEVYSGPYVRIATPPRPISVDELPAELASIVNRARFVDLCFADHRSIEVGDVRRCVASEDRRRPR